MSNSQLNKINAGIKNSTEVTLNLSSNVTGNSNDETNFRISYYWLINKFWCFVKLFNSSANIKLSKTQLHKIGISARFFGRILGPLLKTKTAAAAAADAAIQKNIFRSCTT